MSNPNYGTPEQQAEVQRQIDAMDPADPFGFQASMDSLRVQNDSMKESAATAALALIGLEKRWIDAIAQDDRVINNPESTKLSGVLERNRLMTVNDVRRELLKEFQQTAKRFIADNSMWLQPPNA